jgi:hypothetical protein
MESYETAIRFISETYFMGNLPMEDSDVVSLIAFIYKKDELRVIKDINDYIRKRG